MPRRFPLPAKKPRKLPPHLTPEPEPADLDPAERIVTSETVRALIAELRRGCNHLENMCTLLDAPQAARALLVPRHVAMTDRQVRALQRTVIAHRTEHLALCLKAWIDGQPLPKYNPNAKAPAESDGDSNP